eukprot:4118940-Pyramimonas_sp.AAC.1
MPHVHVGFLHVPNNVMRMNSGASGSANNSRLLRILDLGDAVGAASTANASLVTPRLPTTAA